MIRTILTVAVLTLAAKAMHAQALPTASGGVTFSAFAGVTGAYTGLNGGNGGSQGRNLSITAGGDLGIRPYFSLYPSLEVRGTYPVDQGKVNSEKNLLAGLKLAHPFGRLVPYVDFLAGGGIVDYGSGYLDNTGTLLFVRTSGLVLSPGAGVDLDLTPTFSLKGDFQLQRYGTGAVPSGHIYAKALTAAIVYHFGFNRGGFPTR